MAAVLETGRLRLRFPWAEDDAFFLALLNDPDWHRFVNDPGVRDRRGRGRMPCRSASAGW